MAEAPLSAEEIAHRGFPSTFRGFDPVEVRAYLVRISNELKAAAARERELQQRLTDAERRAANPVIDQAMLTRALGEETSRVLVSAQNAAHDLKARAEESVAGILREAHEQAQRIRAEAEAVLAERTDEAEAAAAEIRSSALAEAQAVVERARREAEAARTEVAEQSRQLVQEAQAARARVLGDLTRRRRIAHTQVEQLRAGRERLLDAYRVVRRTLDEVADELERVEGEARSAAGAAGRRAEGALDAVEESPEGSDGRRAGEGAGDELVVPGRETDQSPPQAPADAKVLAPPASAVAAESVTEEAAPSPAVPDPRPSLPSAPASAPAADPAAPTRPVPATAPSLVVPREQHVEERKLSSLRILRRPKGEPPVGPELEVLERRSQTEGVRVIAAPADNGESLVPPRPSPPRQAPSVMPGVSWAPAPPPAAGEPAPGTDAEDAESEAAPTPPAAARPAPAPPRPDSDPAPAPPARAEPAASPPSPVDAIFARIRADHAGGPATATATVVPSTPEAEDEREGGPATPPPAAEPDTVADTNGADDRESLLQRRDEAIEAIESALVRKLKRAVQDEHNDVLDRLRSYRQVPAAAEFLPSAETHAARYGAAATDLLREAVRAGARFVAPDALPSPDPDAADVADVVADLTEALVGPLRRGVERTIEGHPDDTSVLVDCVTAGYRECRSQRLDGLATDAVVAAFSRGTLTAAPRARLAWVVDDGDRACPDCDDNALAGPTPSGEQYPTGQRHPPAHAGCRCLLVPTSP